LPKEEKGIHTTIKKNRPPPWNSRNTDAKILQKNSASDKKRRSTKTAGMKKSNTRSKIIRRQKKESQKEKARTPKPKKTERKVLGVNRRKWAGKTSNPHKVKVTKCFVHNEKSEPKSEQKPKTQREDPITTQPRRSEEGERFDMMLYATETASQRVQ